MSPRNWKLPLWAQSKWIQWGILTTVLSLACGFLVGRYSLNESPKSSPTGPAQQWQQTGLNFQLLSPLFEGPVCQRDRATMAACLKAIGSLLARHPTRPTLQLIRLHGPPVLWSQEPIGLYGNNLETKDETTRLVPSAPESITSSTQPSSAPATAKRPLPRTVLSMLCSHTPKAIRP